MPASLAGRPFKSIQYCAMSALDRKVPRSFGPESYRHTANGRVGLPPDSPALTTPLLLKSSRRQAHVTVRKSSGTNTWLRRVPTPFHPNTLWRILRATPHRGSHHLPSPPCG